MKLHSWLLSSALFIAATFPVHGADIVACVVADNVQGNSTYYGMATTVTRLKCEFTKQDFYPTLSELYKLGWRLIQVVGGDHALSLGNRGSSPLYFLEREAPPAKAEAKKEKVAPAPKGGGKKK